MSDNPLRVAVVGAGPSGFYAVKALRKAGSVAVDMFDRLPTPFGLVRGGVAPDHQSIKRVVRTYEKVAAFEGFRFFGNVKLGRDLTVDELKRRYHAVIYAVGCETDRKLGIPGENLPGVHSATEFVFWYNSHPDYRDRDFSLDDARNVAVIGNGNVAMDVLRILAQHPDRLQQTDIADYALDVLRRSAVEELFVVGRRGAAQAAFSPREIKEVDELDHAELVVSQRYMELSLAPPTDAWLASDAPRSAQQNVDFLKTLVGRPLLGKRRKIRCWFLTSPVELLGDERLEAVRWVRNELVLEDGWIKPRPTDETWVTPVDRVFVAIGYRGVAIPGVPFDARKGIVRNEAGRVVDDAGLRLGEYVVGWAKRGPTGLIGTNGPDSAATVGHLLDDRADLVDPVDGDVSELLASRGVRVVSLDDWRRIDAVELREGEARGKVRHKFSRVEDILALLQGDP